MKRLFTSLALLTLTILLLPLFNQSNAQEYQSDYTVEYFLREDQSSLKAHVLFTIKTTNLRSDVYVKRFTLSFPTSFAISNLKAKDDNGEIEATLGKKNDKTNIELEFRDPKIGKNSTNTFFLEFDQDNLFLVNGSVWEVILPTIERHGEGSYQVVVTLPHKNKKISISKPKPEKIEGNKIYWNNPNVKTIYAVFGESQMYKLDLIYNLKNPQLTQAIYNIALPPDTAHQKIIIENINPKPSSVYQDEDGNYMARYVLNPRKSKAVFFSGHIKVSIPSRDEVRKSNLSKIKKQEKYLLTEGTYWKVSQPENYKNLRTSEDIYNFIVEKFKYNTDRVSSTNSFGRLGAENALKKPDQAICVEFTDTFIALAREQGIRAREVQGYALSRNSRLRPLSLLRDVLHSWPEYYAENYQDWIQIDPTWGNTSGIDYFNSLDLNHIAFAIHGKNAINPLPAGMYKTENTKDVSVVVSTNVPQEVARASITQIHVERKLDDVKHHQASFKIKNEGNIFLYNVPIILTGENLTVEPSSFHIGSIAPYEEKNIEFTLKAQSRNQFKKAKLTIEVSNYDKKIIEIAVSPYSFTIGFWIATISLLVFGSLILILRTAQR